MHDNSTPTVSPEQPRLSGSLLVDYDQLSAWTLEELGDFREFDALQQALSGGDDDLA